MGEAKLANEMISGHYWRNEGSSYSLFCFILAEQKNQQGYKVLDGDGNKQLLLKGEFQIENVSGQFLLHG